jgi:hypothetical protein
VATVTPAPAVTAAAQAMTAPTPAIASNAIPLVPVPQAAVPGIGTVPAIFTGAQQRWYVVTKGRAPGVYSGWYVVFLLLSGHVMYDNEDMQAHGSRSCHRRASFMLPALWIPGSRAAGVLAGSFSGTG